MQFQEVAFRSISLHTCSSMTCTKFLKVPYFSVWVAHKNLSVLDNKNLIRENLKRKLIWVSLYSGVHSHRKNNIRWMSNLCASDIWRRWSWRGWWQTPGRWRRQGGSRRQRLGSASWTLIGQANCHSGHDTPWSRSPCPESGSWWDLPTAPGGRELHTLAESSPQGHH